ncbi:hypothetical protein ACJMK2_019717 [Sinanodonta woodiana]|uniref:Uncharacterized protein n=1 Tax=Sinanodonta woodiana TaxID=1069815 RepID=A0ABD3TZE9_SINWO
MADKKLWLQNISVVCRLCGMILFFYVYSRSTDNMFWNVTLLGYVIVGGLFIFAAILFNMSFLSPSESHTLKSVCSQYLYFRGMNFIGYMITRLFRKHSVDTKIIQDIVLKQIIKENTDTRMGNILRLGSIKHVDQYLSKVKLTDYSFYEQIVEEIITYRETDALFPGTIDFIARTSGTVNCKSKMFLKSRSLNRRLQELMTLMLYFLQNTIGNTTLRRIHFVHVFPNLRYLHYNVIFQPISSLIQYMSLFFNLTPLKYGQITTEPEAFYIFLLFALAEEDMGNMIFPNSSMALRYFKLLENRWEDLLLDLEDGNISETLQIPDDVRVTCVINLNNRLRSERIKELRTEFQKGFHKIVPRIWPTCPSVSCISTGAFQEQTGILKKRYLGCVPVLCFGHFATEAIYGLNLNMNNSEKDFICLNPINFYEFIPLDDIEQDQPKTYLTHQVEINKMYEMVVTTSDGLYRYRTQDVVEITGFYRTTPVYRFIQRTSDVLSLDNVKVWLFNVSSAIDDVSYKWRSKSVYEYTLVESSNLEKLRGRGGTRGDIFFVIFVELYPSNTFLSEMEINQVDSTLMTKEKEYEKSRRRGKIKPCRMWQVTPGTFDAVFDLILSSNPEVSTMQIKPQKVTRRPDILKLLSSRRIKSPSSGFLCLSKPQHFM